MRRHPEVFALVIIALTMGVIEQLPRLATRAQTYPASRIILRNASELQPRQSAQCVAERVRTKLISRLDKAGIHFTGQQ